MIDPAPLNQARALLCAAANLVVFTGAGVSADSGVPTFRGASTAGEGFWGKYDPMQLASPAGFAKDPKLVYDWYTWRRSQLASIRPNAAHHALATLQKHNNAVVITQNVDGLHERVAPPGAAIHRVHGSLAQDRCMNAPRCDHVEPVDFANPPALRRCPGCGAAYLRPAVVWFGENLDRALWQVCLHACRRADVMLVVGTSGEVYPAAGLVNVAAGGGARIIVANLEQSPLDDVANLTLHGRAAQIIPQVVVTSHTSSSPSSSRGTRGPERTPKPGASGS